MDTVAGLEMSNMELWVASLEEGTFSGADLLPSSICDASSVQGSSTAVSESEG